MGVVDIGLMVVIFGGAVWLLYRTMTKGGGDGGCSGCCGGTGCASKKSDGVA